MSDENVRVVIHGRNLSEKEVRDLVVRINDACRDGASVSIYGDKWYSRLWIKVRVWWRRIR